ncbi:MAG: class I SAM-dependent methyltransferase [Bacteroidales bacterium]
MEIINCYNCKSENHSFYAEENGFSLVKCSSCGLLYIKNRPESRLISQASKQGIHTTGDKVLDVTARYNPNKISSYMKVLDDLFSRDLTGINTWLDIGCGYGEFIQAVNNYSSGKINIKGSEPSEPKQESARKRGLDVEFFDIDTHTGKYNIISLLNVYSHLPDPPAFLVSLKKLLLPGGELIIQTGDTAELAPENHIRPFYLPDHLSFASEKIVVEMLKRKGFEIIVIKKYPFMQFNLKNTVKELAKVIHPRYSSRIRYFFKIKNHPPTNMFIRARLVS